MHPRFAAAAANIQCCFFIPTVFTLLLIVVMVGCVWQGGVLGNGYRSEPAATQAASLAKHINEENCAAACQNIVWMVGECLAIDTPWLSARLGKARGPKSCLKAMYINLHCRLRNTLRLLPRPGNCQSFLGTTKMHISSLAKLLMKPKQRDGPQHRLPGCLLLCPLEDKCASVSRLAGSTVAFVWLSWFCHRLHAFLIWG